MPRLILEAITAMIYSDQVNPAPIACSKTEEILYPRANVVYEKVNRTSRIVH